MRHWGVRLLLGLLLVALALCAYAPAALAQLPPGPQNPPAQNKSGQPPVPQTGNEKGKPESAISVSTAAVHVDVLVTDEDGRVLSGLKKDNFRVFDNGRPQNVTNFAPVSTPITIAMVLEYSAAAYDYFAYKSARWGYTFLGHLQPTDWVALVTYDMKPTVRADFTHNTAEIRDVLSSLPAPAFREANLFDALLDTLDRLDRIKGKKAILLVTTGADTFSKTTLDQAIRRLRESDVGVFCVGVAEAEFQEAEARGQISSSGNLNYLQSRNQLESFARTSGGMAWFPRFEGELPSIFNSVAAMLRNQYRIAFSPAESSWDSKYHKLKIQVVEADGSPLKVTDKKGRQRKIIVYAREGYVAEKNPRRW